jgi:HSP20 family molecular chaperone IbpA
VDEERLKATVENGVLSVQLPIKEAAKPRRIEVQ